MQSSLNSRRADSGEEGTRGDQGPGVRWGGPRPGLPLPVPSLLAGWGLRLDGWTRGKGGHRWQM